MNELETSFITMERGGLDAKSLWREGAFFQARENVHVNVGRQQQAGKEDYWAFFEALQSRHQLRDLERNVRDAIAKAAKCQFHQRDFGTVYVYFSDSLPAYSVRKQLEIHPRKTFADGFLQQVKELEKRGHVDSALDILYSRIDRLFRAKKFDLVNVLLQQIVADSLGVDLLLGLLTSTLPAKSRLPARSKFYADVEASIKKRNEWEDGLLVGLES